MLMAFFAQNGKTMLHRVAENGNHKMCQILLNLGACVDAQDNVSDSF